MLAGERVARRLVLTMAIQGYQQHQKHQSLYQMDAILLYAEVQSSECDT